MQKKKKMRSRDTAKYTAKDSLFTDLFRDRKYLLQLYQALHPENTTATESAIPKKSRCLRSSSRRGTPLLM